MDELELRSGVIAALLRDTTAAFWSRLAHQMRWAYGEGFEAVANDPLVLPNQKSANLLDRRFYLCEQGLQRAATEGGLVTSGQKIAINGWNYTLVRGGGVSILQNYVQTPADMARPARFREAHAAVNTFSKWPQLDLGDVPAALFDAIKINGLVIHGPVGRGFEKDQQQLGFLNFAVPTYDYKAWQPNIPVSEIVAAFAAQEQAAEVSTQRDIARPEPRREKRRENE